jgi:effector-binding domain-containing protein
MPIGRFARASRLSIKSLRNYDESGLLRPALVDPESGYRYYRIEQLARADAIRSLRMVGMPLAKIGETLDGEAPNETLMSHLVELETQRDELDRMMQQLQLRIETKEYVMSTEVTVKTSEAITALGHRTTTTAKGIFTDIPAGFDRVMTTLVEGGVDPVGAPFTLYHQAPDGDTDGDIVMCVPVATIADEDDLESVVIPAGAAASIIHRGSYDDMGRSHAAAAAWIQEHGHQITGPTREVYLNSPAEVAEPDLLTEVLFPIDAADTDR